jgi:Pyridoxamine 5'-phosphate oxidase
VHSVTNVMASPITRTLAPEECWSLMGVAGIGRVAVTVDGAPRIVPVNYAVVGDVIYFRTAVGTILNNVVSQKVAFEVDAFDSSSRSGWSVCVVGSGRPMPECRSDVVIDSWAPRRRELRYCIVPDEVTGRRLFGPPCGETPPDPQVRLFVEVLPVGTAEQPS